MAVAISKKNLAGLFSSPSVGNQISIVRLQMVKEEQSLYGLGSLKDPETAARLVRPLFYQTDREMVVVLSLDIKNKPVAAEIVAIGGLNSCTVDIRNLFKHALLSNAAGIFLFHSHPSGEPTPSREDRILTEKVRQAGEILEIGLVDSIILGDECYYSFQEESGWETVQSGKGVMRCRSSR